MKELLLHNWYLKVISIAAALLLWKIAAPSPSSETGVTVPLEFRNIPAQTEVYGDGATSAEVRLRGPSSLLRTVSAGDISLAVDLQEVELGRERVLALTPDLVETPLGIEAVRVTPARVRFKVERTISKTVPIVPVLGNVRRGVEVDQTVATPSTVEIQGPESRVTPIDEISTEAITVGERTETFSQTVDLDIPDAIVRIPKATVVKVEVQLRRSGR
jgi:YbbR domain-containing protein